MTSRQNEKGGQKTKKEFPALRDFFSAYLHQDFVDEYGSVAGAVKGFLKDANKQEAAAVRSEWKKWRAQRKNRSLDQIQAEVRTLGGDWLPQSIEELAMVDEALKA